MKGYIAKWKTHPKLIDTYFATYTELLRWKYIHSIMGLNIQRRDWRNK